MEAYSEVADHRRREKRRINSDQRHDIRHEYDLETFLPCTTSPAVEVAMARRVANAFTTWIPLKVSMTRRAHPS